MVMFVYMLVNFMGINADVKTQTKAVTDALLRNDISVITDLGLGCLLISYSFAMAASDGHRERAEQTQLK